MKMVTSFDVFLSWVFLFAAIAIEVPTALHLKYLATNYVPMAGESPFISVLKQNGPEILRTLIINYTVIQFCHLMSLTCINVSMAYLVWTGLGSSATVWFAVLWRGEIICNYHVIAMSLIVVGVMIMSPIGEGLIGVSKVQETGKGGKVQTWLSTPILPRTAHDSFMEKVNNSD